MIRWFAHLPIERKLRVVIMVPAMVAFGIAMTLHVAAGPSYVLITAAATAANRQAGM